MKRSVFGILLAAVTAWVAGCGTASHSGETPASKVVLADLGWDAFNRERLEGFINESGRASTGYDASRPPYAVFDWDNTTIFLDIEEAVLAYQLENLAFGATPAELDKAIRAGIPAGDFVKDYRNAAGEPVNIGTIAPDILESYTWLYGNFDGLKGKLPLEEVKKDPHYADFIAKMRFLYDAIGDTFEHSVSYPWVTYLFAGMTEAQVRRVTVATVNWQKGQPIGKVTWTSPASLSGKSGVVSITWKNGLRVVPEMQDLYRALREAGFDVWVCSASFVDVVREISSNPDFGYGNPADHVLGMELERDAAGVIQPEYRHGYDQTQEKGKTRSIERFLVKKYGYGPSFVAGDSEGDQNMMQDFPDTKLVLIVNRLRKPGTDIGKFCALAAETHGKTDAHFLLQGRDDNTGKFVKSQLHFKFGSQEGAVLPK
jgi:phosphoserine phosphatase